MTRAYRQSPRAASRLFRGEAAVITPEDRQINILNSTATEIWELCRDEPLTLDQICVEMGVRYSAEPERIRDDVEELIAELLEIGALEGVEGPATSSGVSE